MQDLEILRGDIRDPETITPAMDGVTTVYHLAALISIPYSFGAIQSYIDTNVTGTANVLQAARAAGVARFVHVSSSEVYGTALTQKMNERHPLKPRSPYAASKLAADKLAEAFHIAYDLPVIIVRPFNAFGPRQSLRAVIPTIIRQALNEDYIHLGSISTKRDWTFVQDTVDALILAGEADERILGKTINVGSGLMRPVAQVVEEVCRLVDREGMVVKLENQRVRMGNSEVSQLCCDNHLAKLLLGWQPNVTFTKGLEQTIRWMREWLRDGRYNRENTYEI